MSETKEYLEQIVKLKKSMVKPKDFIYLGAEDFVLKEGREFKVNYRKLNKYPMGEVKQCYQNAFNLALAYPELIYVEGFASTVIPTMHAWVIDQKGVVYDPTWSMKERKEEYRPTGYYGVPFSLKQCWEVMGQSNHYGVLDAWQAGWPLYKKKFIKEVTV